MAQDIQQLSKSFLEQVRSAENVTVLTGAGVSTGSGIPDFRGPSGLYSKLSQRIFEIDYFYSHPEKYYQIAIRHIHTLCDKSPNPTHYLLAELEKQGLIDGIITQNIDGLHHKAGSKNVIEFHGDVNRFYCTECFREFKREYVETMIRKAGLPTCDNCHALIRPGIVFFGDPIPENALHESQKLTENCDLFVAMGSSLAVHPAAGLAMLARQIGAKLLIVNMGPTEMDTIADQKLEVDLSAFSETTLKTLTNL